MKKQQLKELLEVKATKLYIFTLFFFFVFIWLKTFGAKFYYFIISAILIYLYACDIVVKIEQEKIKDEISLIKDLATKFIIIGMIIALMMFLMRKI